MKTELRACGAPYAAAVRDGLGALRRQHRSHIKAHTPRRLTGSIDLDATLATDPEHVGAPRWDYGIGFRTPTEECSCAVWVEVHPANPGAVNEVIRKAAWLQAWLSAHATIDHLTCNGAAATSSSALFWVPTGTDSVSYSTASARKLANSGIVKRRQVVLP